MPSTDNSLIAKRVRSFKNTGWVRDLTPYKGKLFFSAHPYESDLDFGGGQLTKSVIWTTDGTADGTKILKDFAPGSDRDSQVLEIKTANDRLFITTRLEGYFDSSNYE